MDLAHVQADTYGQHVVSQHTSSQDGCKHCLTTKAVSTIFVTENARLRSENDKLRRDRDYWMHLADEQRKVIGDLAMEAHDAKEVNERNATEDDDVNIILDNRLPTSPLSANLDSIELPSTLPPSSASQPHSTTNLLPVPKSQRRKVDIDPSLRKAKQHLSPIQAKGLLTEEERCSIRSASDRFGRRRRLGKAGIFFTIDDKTIDISRPPPHLATGAQFLIDCAFGCPLLIEYLAQVVPLVATGTTEQIMAFSESFYYNGIKKGVEGRRGMGGQGKALFVQALKKILRQLPQNSPTKGQLRNRVDLIISQSRFLEGWIKYW